MAEYIERTKTAYLLCREICGNDRDLCVSSPENCCQKRMKEFYEIPTADVAPVVHGKWMLKHVGAGHYWECSNCHENPCIYVTENTRFCPNCGAKMDASEPQMGAD